jgi:ATP-dependent helicase Lhr and Lhr-like helicase
MNQQQSFDRLHPAVQHHIVNTLGWSGLRPTQEAAISPILDGKHCILLAPTAGGKTEAAIFPVLSRMLAEDWRGMSVLYVCPIRALLNNLEPRLSFYFGLVGRRVGIWHGDISESVKKKARKEPPDLLLTTPESLEGMLISSNDEKRAFLADVRLVIIDEMHAFCNDDRGWHVRCVTRRLSRLVGRPLQVLGLTATVGNPKELIDWMVPGEETTVVGVGHSGTDADIVVDYVGSLENAATIISRLHNGEKRLVFCDSRAKTEELTAHLRELGVRTFVSHSSLSVDERRQAEKAFTEEPNCVIVATSTLELGIDVGDLDRVIQIDAPTSVASFLQRMGRTGRRAGAQRNCLFLATDDEGLLIGGAIVRMWREGYVEPITPPATPWHLVAQQAIALNLQHLGLPRAQLAATLRDLFGELDPEGIDRVIQSMIGNGVLWEDNGLVALGQVGEEEFGRRHFESIVSTFNSPLVLTVLYGQREIGFVDPMTLQAGNEKSPVLILGGRYWRLVSFDWKSRVAYVEPSENKGKASWLGSSRFLRYDLCQAIKHILVDQQVPASVSQRALTRLGHLAESYLFLEGGKTSSVRKVQDGKSDWRWWTFAGGGANFWLAEIQQGIGRKILSYDNFSIRMDAPPATGGQIGEIAALSESGNRKIRQMAKELKFSSCLPDDMAVEVIKARVIDHGGANRTLALSVLAAQLDS